MSSASLIMLIGRPASGKSYLGRRIAERLGIELLQTDVLRREMFRRPRYTGPEHGAVYAEAHRRLAAALRAGRSIIFDATNLGERKRRVVYRIADEAEAGLVIALAYAPREAILARLAARQAGADPLDWSEADWTVYRKLGRTDPISRPHLVVNTTVDLGQAVELIAARVRSGGAGRN